VLLRTFFKALQKHTQSGTIFDMATKDLIDEEVYLGVKRFYPLASRQLILDDLQMLIKLVIDIGRGKPVPESLGGNQAVLLKSMSAPHRMDLVVAPMVQAGLQACPLSCAACYAKSGNAMTIEAPLDTHAWKAIIDRCKGAGIPMLTFTGGEPLTRPDIVELVAHAAWFVTRLNTSGVTLTRELAQDLRAASLDGIQITLYSHDAKIHDKLVGVKGAFERTVTGICHARDAGLEVSLNTPLVQLNADYLSLIAFAHDMGICHLTCSALIPVGGAIEQLSGGEALEVSALQSLLTQAVSRCRALEMNLSFTSPGWLSDSQIKGLGLPSTPLCGACASNMAITPLGYVVPCQSWLGGDALGQMLKSPWHKIWNHPLCKQLRRDASFKNACALDKSKGGL